MSTKLINDLRKAYVDVLAKHRKLYHFDDSAKDIIHHKTGEPLFTKEEEEILDQIKNNIKHRGGNLSDIDKIPFDQLVDREYSKLKYPQNLYNILENIKTEEELNELRKSVLNYNLNWNNFK